MRSKGSKQAMVGGVGTVSTVLQFAPLADDTDNNYYPHNNVASNSISMLASVDEGKHTGYYLSKNDFNSNYDDEEALSR